MITSRKVCLVDLKFLQAVVCTLERKKKNLAYKMVGVDGAVLEFEVCMHRPVYILILLMLRSCRQTLLNRCLMVGG